MLEKLWCWCWNPNSYPQVCRASILSTEPSSHPLTRTFLLLFSPWVLSMGSFHWKYNQLLSQFDSSQFTSLSDLWTDFKHVNNGYSNNKFGYSLKKILFVITMGLLLSLLAGWQGHGYKYQPVDMSGTCCLEWYYQDKTMRSTSFFSHCMYLVDSSDVGRWTGHTEGSCISICVDQFHSALIKKGTFIFIKPLPMFLSFRLQWHRQLHV